MRPTLSIRKWRSNKAVKPLPGTRAAWVGTRGHMFPLPPRYRRGFRRTPSQTEAPVAEQVL
jgi:hypothetical protein